MNSKQKLILRKLVGANGLKYSELFHFFTYEDKFPYHLKYLLTKGLISKKENRYFLTKEGIKVTVNFDSRTLEEHKVPHPLILFICQHKNKFLVREYFDDPEIKVVFLPFASPVEGLLLADSCSKEFSRKYKFNAKFKYRSTYHLLSYTSDGDLQFDDLWLVVEAMVDNIDDKKTAGLWLSKKEISQKSNVHQIIKKLILDNDRNIFIEESIVFNYGIKKSNL